MQDIDINELDELKNKLSDLTEDDAIFINENGKEKYAVITSKQYDIYECYRASFDENPTADENVQMIINGMVNGMSYDEYESLKKQLIDVFDKAFKPKADKLN